MRKWKPSKAAQKDFAIKMKEIETFCSENGIDASKSNDSYYFTINDKKYRVSNHTIKASNAGAFIYNELTGQNEQIRELYHSGDEDIICITAGKTRIIEIYNDLKNGYELDKRGNRI